MKPFSKYINQAGSLDRIRRSTRQLDSLTRQIQAAVPVDAAGHLVGCALQPATVIVFCDSAAWAAQLRYSQQSILDVCRRVISADIRHVRFRIFPSETPAGKPPAPEIAENSRRVIEQAAKGVSDDELAEALRRLSLNSNQDAD